MQIIDKVAMPTTQPPYAMIETLFAAAEVLLAKHRRSQRSVRRYRYSWWSVKQ